MMNTEILNDTDMTSICSIKETDLLSKFQLNPHNIRPIESIACVPITRTVDGQVTDRDDDGNLIGFELNPEYQCSPEYRTEFNKYLASLITIEGDTVHYATLENSPIIVGKDDQGIYWTGDGNTRLAILKALHEFLGERLTFVLHYTQYKGQLSLEEWLFAASTIGYNSFVPVQFEDTVQAHKMFDHLIQNGASIVGAVALVKDTFLKSKKNPTGWSTAKWSYVATSLAMSGVLTPNDRSRLNTEFASKYLRMVYGELTGDKYRVGDTLSPELKQQMSSWMAIKGVAQYAEQTMRTADWRITSDNAWNSYVAWAKEPEVLTAPPTVEAVEETKPDPEVQPLSTTELADLSNAFYVLHESLSRMETPELVQEVAKSAKAPLMASIEAIAQTKPELLREVILAVAEMLDFVTPETLEDTTAKGLRSALKSTQKSIEKLQKA